MHELAFGISCYNEAFFFLFSSVPPHRLVMLPQGGWRGSVWATSTPVELKKRWRRLNAHSPLQRSSVNEGTSQ